MGDPVSYSCGRDQKVLLALEGSRQMAVRVGCRQGGCGACRVRVVSGQYRTTKMSVDHVTPEERAQGFVLSCRLFPESDLVIEPAFVSPKQSRNQEPD
ncbi:MAG TPA: 2Fe-2S iron-sulfur cluster-binding protein [Dongiaceae bacterium]|nr:2Fe-2S iron-sulfur cluster-binding protein [Dongiaceae bacterium]